jgi:hypothetical protein
MALKYDLTKQWIGGEAYEPGAKFNYLRHVNRIPLSKFCYPIKSISPKAKSFMPYWKEEIRRVFEGHWAEHQVVNEAGELQTIAKWLPPWTHFHVVHWMIEVTESGLGGEQKVWRKPSLRDLEWIRGYVFATAKGFSGFEGDDEYTCYRPLGDGLPALMRVLPYLSDEKVATLRRKDGTWKKYKPALPYLYEEQPHAMGRPLFMNVAKNVGDIEARGSGKTYDASGRTGWAWVTEGMTNFDEYNKLRREKVEPTTQQMFLSYDVKDQKTLLRGFFKAVDEMPGGGVFDGYEKPKKSPLYKRWKGGTLTDTGTIEQRFERVKSKGNALRTKKKGGGSGNQLHVRSCMNDPTAGNGPRCSHIFIEEAGFVENLLALLGQLIATTSDNGVQYGVIWFSGTGGETKGVATAQVRTAMENPADYNCLEFANVMENIEQTIGMFVPAHLMLNKYKDEFGNTDFGASDAWLEDEYRKAELSRNAKTLLDLKTRNPRTLNDALLSLTGTKFPTAALTDVLTQISLFPKVGENKAVPGYMQPIAGNHQAARFVPDLTKTPLEDYPIKFSADMSGAFMVLEEADPTLPDGYYVAGCDPYNQDEVKESESVGACYIIRRAFGTRYPQDRIVAWYVGRPKSYDDYYEQVRLGCCYYNAVLLPENETSLVRDHFTRNGSLGLLAPPPPLLRANILNAPVRAFGQNMSPAVKRDLLAVTNKWLIEPVYAVNQKGELEMRLAGANPISDEDVLHELGADMDKVLNLHFVSDPGLLREMINYTEGGNYDRVIAFMLAVAQLFQMRGNAEMAQAHSQVAAMLLVLERRKATSRRSARRHIEGLEAFLVS